MSKPQTTAVLPKIRNAERPKPGNYEAQKQLDQRTTPAEDKRREEERARAASFLARGPR